MADRIPTAEEAQLLELISEEGSPIGNLRLLRELHWEEQRYFEVRDRLVDDGVLSLGRGRGGSVYRRVPAVVMSTPQEVSATVPQQYRRERELYKPIISTLENGWAQAWRNRNFLFENISAQGRKATGGMGTRPDIVAVTVDTYAYVPGKFLELITFEVKPAGNWDVAGVFEAASHSRFATQTHLMLYAPTGLPPVSEAHLERLRVECARFQVGLVLLSDPASYESYEFLVDPERRQPDPAEMDRFISQQLSDGAKRRISEWLH